MEKGYSNHHIIPKSRESDGYNVHCPKNMLKLKLVVHENLHRLFENKTPDEQLLFILELNRKVIDENIYGKLEKLISNCNFYKDCMYK